jgi:hypothetical protein
MGSLSFKSATSLPLPSLQNGVVFVVVCLFPPCQEARKCWSLSNDVLFIF